MTRRSYFWMLAAMFAIGAAIRVNNALVFSPLRGYDGFAHYSYIWFLAEHDWIPRPTSGWQFFQPPLYYALMAKLWNALPGVDAILRLQLGSLVSALLGLVHAWTAIVLTRRVLPGHRVAAVAAAGLMLFLPMHLYSAGFIGNEYVCAALCSASLLALLRVLDRPTIPRALLLGMLLGAAIMTKFTAMVAVAGAFGTIGLRMLLRREWKTGLRTMVVAGTVVLLAGGWFYGRNVMLYGTPFQMSRETFVLARYEHVQTKGRRTIWEYVLFDPGILYRPQWPRGVPLVQETPIPYEYGAARESVLTGIYANAWFDGYGGWVLPAVWQSEVVRRAGQALLTLGMVPSLLVLAGLGIALARLRRDGWDDTLVASLTTFAAMLVVVVHGTSSVATHAAVKATYLLPVAALFGLWFALGLDWLQRWKPRWQRGALVACVAVAAISGTVFLQGRTVARDWFGERQMTPLWENMYGVVYHAAGDRETARRYFRAAADDGYHLGVENLAIMAMDDGEPDRALHYMRRAAMLQPYQSFGTPADRIRFNLHSAAEYRNTMAVLYHELDWPAAAIDSAQRAVETDPSLPEARYDLAVLAADLALRGPARRNPEARRAWLERSRNMLIEALALDPEFLEARALAAALAAEDGRCDDARATLAEMAALDGHRLYPVKTGIGDMLAASIRRRHHVTRLPEELTVDYQLAKCGKDAGGTHGS